VVIGAKNLEQKGVSESPIGRLPKAVAGTDMIWPALIGKWTTDTMENVCLSNISHRAEAVGEFKELVALKSSY
jgi:hypothetical protein